MTKKRKPQDATMRNIRGKATKVTLARVAAKVAKLDDRLSFIERILLLKELGRKR